MICNYLQKCQIIIFNLMHDFFFFLQIFIDNIMSSFCLEKRDKEKPQRLCIYIWFNHILFHFFFVNSITSKKKKKNALSEQLCYQRRLQPKQRKAGFKLAKKWEIPDRYAKVLTKRYEMAKNFRSLCFKMNGGVFRWTLQGYSCKAWKIDVDDSMNEAYLRHLESEDGWNCPREEVKKRLKSLPKKSFIKVSYRYLVNSYNIFAFARANKKEGANEETEEIQKEEQKEQYVYERAPECLIRELHILQKLSGKENASKCLFCF
ncbi:hypothetical protein RFI_30579, partial [Reticulomyxa filosa]